MASHPRPGKPYFPLRSDRERLHKIYHTETEPTNVARRLYYAKLAAIKEEYGSITGEERDHYSSVSDGLYPEHHERLLPRAETEEDRSYKMAKGREGLVSVHPYAYHDLKSQRH